jgi:hypothetical protein
MNPSKLTACLLAVAALSPTAPAQSLTRAPYLQNGSTTAVSVRWRTNSATDSLVRYGTSAEALNQSVARTTATTEHEIRLTGLTPDTTYYYSVGNSAKVLASGNDYFVRTAPTGAKPTRIWVLGDSGTNSSGQRAVPDAYYRFTGSRHTDLWMMLGDNAYESGTDSEYQSKLFNIYPTMLRKSVLWSCYGNHDAGSSNSSSQTGPYYAQHTFPKQGEAGGVASGTEAYYSYDYGNIHFIALDSCESSRSTTGAMAKWLRNDLANTTKDWVVAFWHHPPYSRGSHNSDSESTLREMRERFVPILESYGVDLVLCGHSHSYERSKFIDGHHGKSTTFNDSMVVQPGNGRDGGAYTKAGLGPIPNSGAVFAVAGASGKLSGGTLNHPAMVISLNVYGSMVLDFDGGRLDALYLDRAGSIRDRFTILKSGLGNKSPDVALTGPAPGTVFTAPATIPLQAVASDTDGSIAKVEFYHGPNLIGTDTTAPYTYQWSGVEVGNYSITARATDNLGASRNSEALGINVIGAPPAGTTVATFRQGINGYAGMTDTHLLSDNPDANFGNAGSLMVDGSPDQTALLKWDLGSIPPGSPVSAVSLTFQIADDSTSSYGIHALNRPWSESGATWNLATGGTPWTTPGASHAPDDIDPTPIGSIVASPTGIKTITLNAHGLAKVQSWIDNPASNHGLILQNYIPSSGFELASSESPDLSERPMMSVTYIAQDTPGNLAPLVSLADPATSLPLVSPVNLTLSATASDPDGSIARVEFYNGPTLLGTATSAPYQFLWSAVAAGSHSLTAKAFDNLGASTVSAAVPLTVNPPPVPDPDPETEPDPATPVTVSFRQGASGYAGMTDTHILSDATSSNFGGVSTLMTDGSPDYSSLFKWDLSAIPVGKTVSAVTLTFHVTDTTTQTYNLYALTREWSESAATWTKATSTSNWTSAGASHVGGDRESQAIGTITPSATGSITLSLGAAGVAKVQSWINQPATNHGFIIQDYDISSGFDLSSSEASVVSQRPMITITYQ